MTRTFRGLPAILVALLLLGGACGRDDGDAASTTTTSTTAASGRVTTGGGGSTTTVAGGVTTTTTGGSSAGTTSVPSGDESGRVIEVSIVGGDVEGGVRRENVTQGAQVTIRVTSDVTDQLHVHGDDLTIDLTPNQSADLTFLPRTRGVVTVELERRGAKVLELDVGA